MRHKEIHDTFARLMSESYYDVVLEPKLQSPQGESFPDNIRSTFSPFASLCPNTIKDAYSYHGQLKNLKYETRIVEVEDSSINL